MTVEIRVNGLKNCDTCRKALRALTAAGHTATLRDLREIPPNAEELSAWWQAFGPALLNTRSTTWRGLSETDRGTEPQTLMLAHPALIKRPVIEAGGSPSLGWTKDVQKALGL